MVKWLGQIAESMSEEQQAYTTARCLYIDNHNISIFSCRFIVGGDLLGELSSVRNSDLCASFHRNGVNHVCVRSTSIP